LPSYSRDGDDTPGEDGEPHRADFTEVANDPVDDEGSDATTLGDRTDVAASDRVVDVARAGDPGDALPQGAHADIHDVLWAEDVGERRRGDVCEDGGVGHLSPAVGEKKKAPPVTVHKRDL
jgi:hypothetical protein